MSTAADRPDGSDPSSPRLLGETGGFRIFLESRLEKIQEFWAIAYVIQVREYGLRDARIWPIRHHHRSRYLIAYDREGFMVGGVRLLLELGNTFYSHEQIGQPDRLPPMSAFQALGRVGEAGTLMLLPEVRGLLRADVCDRVLRDLAREVGLTHLVVNAVIPWRVAPLYRMFGYQAYAAPIYVPRYGQGPDDDRPNMLPMITSLYPNQEMLPDSWKWSVADLVRMTDDYIAQGRERGWTPVAERDAATVRTTATTTPI